MRNLEGAIVWVKIKKIGFFYSKLKICIRRRNDQG